MTYVVFLLLYFFIGKILRFDNTRAYARARVARYSFMLV